MNSNINFLGYYLHFTEHGHLEICSCNDLCSNKLNGKIVVNNIFSEGYASAERHVNILCSHYDIQYIVISADPFCLPLNHAKWFRSLPFPKGLILCDTHHGTKPLSRSLQFCKVCRVNSIILRFNQRHSKLFQKHKIWSDATIISPDLHLTIKKYSGIAEQILKKYDSNIEESDLKNKFKESPGNIKTIFVGNMKNAHPFRKYQIQLLENAGFKIATTITPGVSEMIESMREYEVGLNLPLNGDFNRRFIETMMSNRYVFSEYIPKSQRVFPFNYLLRSAVYFLYTNDGVLKIDYGNLNSWPEKVINRDPLRTLLHLYKSGYDEHILHNYHKSLLNSKDKHQSEIYDYFRDSVEYYEKGMDMNINPLSISKNEACKFMNSATHHSEKLGIDLNDELFRLKSLSRT